jgi:WD40 repeat protein/serine/threonine protein kinase
MAVFGEPLQIRGYEVLELIGQGGFGAVYRAFQPTLGREVAIKVILPEFANSDEFIRRFEAEAQLVARLEHPHIVPLFDYWREPDSAYLVMRYIRGGSLTADLRKKGQWTPEATLRMLDQIGGALIVAHRHNIVHRDIKPDNILIDEDRNCYLTDFGIARFAGHHDVDDGISGSLAYMAPEQLTGGDLSPSADVYSLAFVLYEMLTGTPVFGEADQEHIITRRIFNATYSPIEMSADLPEPIRATLFRATFRDPADRHESIREFIEDFERAVAELSLTTQYPAIDLSALSNPYKGLRSFEEADALDFFGRDALIGTLLDRLREAHWASRFLAVVGPSGSGKSSVVKAGLIPALRHGGVDGSETWFIVEMVPGVHPLRSLETALLSVSHRPPPDLRDRLAMDEQALVAIVNRSVKNEVLFVIDQFEEVYTLCEDEDERGQFLMLLHRAVIAPTSRVRVVITLRADFYDKPLLDKNFGALIQGRTQVVLPLGAKEVEQAITGPAHRVGLVIDPDLIASMIADTSAESGALPLLQYALTELYDQRDGVRLSAYTYGQIGGISGVLAKRAEEVYQSLSEPLQALTRQLYLRLVAVHEEQFDTRRRVRRSELLSLVPADRAMQVDAVINAFGKHRLLTFDIDASTREPMVIIAHEALLRTWDKLRDWLASNRNAIRMERLLANAAHEWQVNDRKPDFLLQGTRLAQFRDWARTTEIVLTPSEHEFLALSLSDDEQRQAVESERQRRLAALERRNRNGARLLVGGALLAALVFLVLAASASTDRAIAESARATSEFRGALAVAAQATSDRRAVESNSVALASNALMLSERNPLLALPLIITANQVSTPPPFASRVLSDIAYRPRLIAGLLTGHSGTIYGVAYTPDGAQVLTASYDQTLILWDAATRQPLRTLRGHTDGVTSVAVLPDGKHALSASYDQTLILWELATGNALRTFGGHEGGVLAVAVSADGKRALSGSLDETAILWDVATGEVVRQLRAHTDAVSAVALSRDGTRAITGGRDAVAITWDTATGAALKTRKGHAGAVSAVALSPDGQKFLTASDDKLLVLWELESGIRLRTFIGHSDLINAVAFTPDGTQAISASFDQQVIVWDVLTGLAKRTLIGHTGAVHALAISGDGAQLTSGGTDLHGIMWTLTAEPNGALVRSLSAHSDWVNAVARSADGKWLLSAGSDSWAMVWDATAAAPTAPYRQFKHRGMAWAAAFSPAPTADGHWLALTGDDAGVMYLWNVDEGRPLRTFEAHNLPVNAVAFSPDGTFALSASDDGTILLWRVATGEKVRTLQGHTDAVNSVAFLPDGKLALSGSTDRTLRLWNVETGRPIRTLTGHTGAVWRVVVSADGRTALSTSSDTTLMQWDLINSRQLRTLVGHSSIVWSVALSPDGTLAVSGSDDKAIMIWDLTLGQAVRVYRTDHVPLAVDFSVTGKTIYAGLDDHSVSEWRADTLTDLIAWTYTNRVVRDLTCAERATFLLTDC